MCGIFGIITKSEKEINKIVDGLLKLEYRGYDSSGISFIKNNGIKTIKSVGKIKNLEDKINGEEKFKIAISHTRWATHGEANEINAHPHLSNSGNIAIVHNGIIENYQEIREKLINNGFDFKSVTDTEVIPNLIEFNLKNNSLEDAFFKTINELDGAFAIAMVGKNLNKIFVAKKGSPLSIGITDDTCLLSSAISAFSGFTNKIITLEDLEVAILEGGEYNVYDFDKKIIKKEVEVIEIDDINVDKGDFEHFMLKEIFEQDKVLEKTINEYINKESKTLNLSKFNFDLKTIKKIKIIACGTSYYAGCVAKYLIEEIANIFVDVDIASEARYRNTPLNKDEVAIFISQSGETADTIAALKLCKENDQKIISIVNVIQSNIAKLSDVVLKTMAGVEIGVASTKAFVAQVSLMYLLALEIGKENGNLNSVDYSNRIEEFIKSPKVLHNILQDKSIGTKIQKIAEEFSKESNIIYIGRNIFYPLALEGALKLKEISYIHAYGIAAGELKHGPIALIDENTFVLSLNSSNLLLDKSLSSVEEIFTRKGKIISIADKECNDKMRDKLYNSIDLNIEKTSNTFNLFLSSIVPLQLIAYYTALNKGLDIDKPRNLAKSVTVE